MRVLWAVDHGLNAASKRMTSQLGVTGPQRLVLRIVGRFPDIVARDLAAILHLHKSTMTGVIARLEARGVIERRTDPADRRSAKLRLTPKGVRLDEARAGTVEAVVKQVVARSPAQRIAAARALLLDLASALAPPSEPPRRPARSVSRRR